MAEQDAVEAGSKTEPDAVGPSPDTVRAQKLLLGGAIEYAHEIAGDTVVQEVLISGSDGEDWTALYQVVKQPDGSYKINGVHMIRAAPGPEI